MLALVPDFEEGSLGLKQEADATPCAMPWRLTHVSPHDDGSCGGRVLMILGLKD